jgi:class 3 adenylate cyclase/pimeloyl-ACP methyl ester carboxylesterase
MQPDTRYTQSTGGVNIAYQVVGNGPRDLVMVPGWIFHVELAWEHPAFETMMRRLTKSFRVIMFDKRGTGLSDRAAGASPMEERMDDIRAVMDAAGSEAAAIMGWSEGGNISMMFAATHPERTEALILYATAARYSPAPDYTVGLPQEVLDVGRDILQNNWGQGLGAMIAAPSRLEDPAFLKWFGRYERMTVSPGEGIKMLDVNMEIDTRPLLGTIRTHTLVLHNEGDRLVPVECGRYLAARIPDATLVELPGDDHLFWFSNTDAVVGEIENFVLGTRADDDPERALSTVLFTDIVGSTQHASRVGDGHWKEILDQHDRIVRERLPHFRGKLVKTTGDGVLATFDGPARAVQCALRLHRDVAALGLGMRAGVHTGEVELRTDDVGGVAVHIAARIAALAEPGTVFTSRTVKDLVAGAGISFTDRGDHELKGMDEPWRVFEAS